MGLEAILEVENSLSSDSVESLSLMKSSCSSIKETLNEMINFLKVDDETMEVHSKPNNLKQLVKNVALGLVSTAKKSNVMLLLAIDHRLPDFLLFDKLRMRQVH
jgi:signal transduction histidine kinase